MAKKNRNTNLTKLHKSQQQAKQAKQVQKLYSDGNGSSFLFKKARVNGINCFEMGL